MNYKKIKLDKIQEANDFYKMIGIENYEENYSDTNPILPELVKEFNEDKKVEFHWTRLSINSNIGLIVE